MTFRLSPVAVIGLGLLAAVSMSTASAADAAKGKVLAYTCHGCHGVPDYKNAYPNYRVPKLGGQSEAYLVSALNAYAKGAYTPTWDGQPNAPVQFQGMALWSGTSFSTPLVAGLVAARMSSTGQSSRRAWGSLLGLAERQAVPGLGPVLYPGQELA